MHDRLYPTTSSFFVDFLVHVVMPLHRHVCVTILLYACSVVILFVGLRYMISQDLILSQRGLCFQVVEQTTIRGNRGDRCTRSRKLIKVEDKKINLQYMGIN